MNNTFAQFAKDLICEEGEPKYGCLMAMISPDLSGQFVDWAFDHIDPKDVIPDNGKPGYETEPHITILYGFHPDVTHQEVLNTIKNFGPIEVTLGKISKFKQEDQDVLKIDVESQDLHNLNALLMKKFADRVTNKYPEYHPHQTIAYVAKGAGEDIDPETFDGFEMTITNLVYSYGGGEEKIHQTLQESIAQKQRYKVSNVFVRGYRVSGETMAYSEKSALINLIMRNLTPEQKNNPRDYIHRALEVGGYKIELVTSPIHPDPKWEAQRKMTNKIWGPIVFGKSWKESSEQIIKYVPASGRELPDFVDKAFDKLANDQRDAPENAMLKATMFHSGVWAFCLEHIGDLTHRMAQHPKFFNGGGEYVLEKVKKCLRYLTQDFGFANEVQMNLRNNHEHNSKGMTFEQYKTKCYLLGKEYAEEHKKLVVYNSAQWFARQAAIDIGYGNFLESTLCLRQLEKMLKDDWVSHALTYYLNANKELVPYTLGMENISSDIKI